LIKKEKKQKLPNCRGGLTCWRRTTNNEQYCVNLLIAIPISLIAGILSGMVGIGGGILKVPALVLLLGVPVDIAVASSSFMVGLTAGGGFIGHLIGGIWEWKRAIPLAMVVFVGAQIGSRISIGLEKKKLEKIFGGLLLSIAIFTIIRML
jgi:uncharacterized membrane protein YfcA